MANKTSKPEASLNQASNEAKRWNVGGLFWGLLVILIGGLMLLDNIGVYDFDLARIWQLWPIIIVGIGVSMLSLRGWLAALVSGLLIVGTLASIVYVTAFEQNTDSGETETVSQVISAPEQSADQASELTIDTGATSLALSSDESIKFADVKLTSNNLSLHHEDVSSGDEHRVKVETRSRANGWMFMTNGFNNLLDVKLAENRLIDLKIDAGAAKIDGDLSDVRIRKLTIDSGAASGDIKLGNRVKKVSVVLDVGASSMTLRLPKDSAVRVETDGGLSSTDFDGIPEFSEDVYQTDDFNSNDKQIVIKADTGASSFRIVRY